MTETAPRTPAPFRRRSVCWSGRPAKAGKYVLVKVALDGQIPRQRIVGGSIRPDPLDLSDDGSQAGCRGLAFGDVDSRARVGPLHYVGAPLGKADGVGDAAARREGTEGDKRAGGHLLSKAWHEPDTDGQPKKLQTQSAFLACARDRGKWGTTIGEPFSSCETDAAEGLSPNAGFHLRPDR
jgi:hypothetical protein